LKRREREREIKQDVSRPPRCFSLAALPGGGDIVPSPSLFLVWLESNVSIGSIIVARCSTILTEVKSKYSYKCRGTAGAMSVGSADTDTLRRDCDSHGGSQLGLYKNRNRNRNRNRITRKKTRKQKFELKCSTMDPGSGKASIDQVRKLVMEHISRIS
jgi:hypothetical protein